MIFDLSYRTSIHVGTTDFNPNDIKHIVETLGKEYRGDQYHLLNKNCNHFTESVVQVCRLASSTRRHVQIFKKNINVTTYSGIEKMIV